MTYPSGRVVNFGHDNKGRLTSVGSVLSSVTYNGIGRVTGRALGNGVTESYGYDANRMQLTTQTATKSGGPQNGLMNLTYGYQAAAGQMGAGSTAGNAGQLMSISGTINGTTESAGYTYDLLGRLTTSNQTSNGSSSQRRFAYDRWGNRTSMWDAVSGGNQVQSVVLQQSGGAPTNRLTSVTTSGVTATYTYDAAGNVTNDGVRTYSFDAENRVVSVDGGATASYAYDASNQRYKKVTGGATTHYVWQPTRVIAEHNGTTGASIADYIYSGSRMIAKASGLNTQYFLSDRLSVRVTLDSSGNVLGRQAHLPFGENFGESGAQEKDHFTTYERDGESGTDYAVNRQYDQSVGRFNRVDPLQSSATKAVPQSWNRYAYVENDPTNSVDPLGLLTHCPPGSTWILKPDGNWTCVPPAVPNPDVPDWGDHIWPFIDVGPISPPTVPDPVSCAEDADSGNADSTNAASADYESDSAKNTGKVYSCSRPLTGLPIRLPSLFHMYICVERKDGTCCDCVGLNNSGSRWGSPGINNPNDQYDPNKCSELWPSNPCFVKCVRKKIKQPLPYYDAGPGGEDCMKWAGRIISTCRKDCKVAG